MQTPGGTPLNLTTNPRLDAALAQGPEAFAAAVAEAGTEATARWLAARVNGAIEAADLREAVEALLAASDPDDRATARAELAELLAGLDDAVAEVLWEGVLAHGEETGDGETIFDAVTHLAGIAEAAGDPLTAAEYHILFLNWRRQDENGADPELVQASFDEIVRLAERDGARTAAAQFAYRAAQFTRLAEEDDDRASEGDWERERGPYESWA